MDIPRNIIDAVHSRRASQADPDKAPEGGTPKRSDTGASDPKSPDGLHGHSDENPRKDKPKEAPAQKPQRISLKELDRDREENQKKYCDQSLEARNFLSVLEERVRNTELMIRSAATFQDLDSPHIVERKEKKSSSGEIRRIFVSDEGFASYFDGEKAKESRPMQLWMRSEITNANRLLRDVWIEAEQGLREKKKQAKQWFAEQEQNIAQRIAAASYPDLLKIGRELKSGKRVFFERKKVDAFLSQFSELSDGERKALEKLRVVSETHLLKAWKKREIAIGEEWAVSAVEELRSLVAEKREWAQQEFEKPASGYTKDQYDTLIAFLASSLLSAESARNDEGRYRRIIHISDEVKNAKFQESKNASESKISVAGVESDTPEEVLNHESVLGFEISVEDILKDNESGDRYRIKSIQGNRVQCVLLSQNRNYSGILSFDCRDSKYKGRFMPVTDQQEGDTSEVPRESSEEENASEEVAVPRSLEETCKVDPEVFTMMIIQSANTLLKEFQREYPREKLSSSHIKGLVSEFLAEALRDPGGITDEETLDRVIGELLPRITRDVVYSGETSEEDISERGGGMEK